MRDIRDFTIAAVTALLVTWGIALASACGNSEDPPYTWGDVSAEMSSVFCQARLTCGWIAESNLEPCYRHSYNHLCEIDDTCFSELPDKAEEDMIACSESTLGLDDEGCLRLLFGRLPAVCDTVWEYQPEPL